jgi:hypothetical protein
MELEKIQEILTGIVVTFIGSFVIIFLVLNVYEYQMKKEAGDKEDSDTDAEQSEISDSHNSIEMEAVTNDQD